MALVILCGIPCAGKTQLAVALAKELELAHGLHTIVIDPDKIREMVPALMSRFDPGREPFVNSLALTLIEESLRQHNVVISDDLNYYESARHRLIQIARKHRAEYAILYLAVSVETAQRRNALRGAPIPQEVILEIAKKFDCPGAKYRWDRPALVLDSEKLTPDQIAKQSLEVLLRKIEDRSLIIKPARSSKGSKRMKRKVTEASSKKKLDESTRRILSDLFLSGELDVKLSKKASKMRRAFVDEAAGKRKNLKAALKEFRRRVRRQFT